MLKVSVKILYQSDAQKKKCNERLQTHFQFKTELIPYITSQTLLYSRLRDQRLRLSHNGAGEYARYAAVTMVLEDDFCGKLDSSGFENIIRLC